MYYKYLCRRTQYLLFVGERYILHLRWSAKRSRPLTGNKFAWNASKCVDHASNIHHPARRKNLWGPAHCHERMQSSIEPCRGQECHGSKSNSSRTRSPTESDQHDGNLYSNEIKRKGTKSACISTDYLDQRALNSAISSGLSTSLLKEGVRMKTNVTSMEIQNAGTYSNSNS